MSESFELQHRAKEIRLKREEKVLEIDFEDGKTFSLRAELLRVESPSAEVQGHGPGQKTIVAGRRHGGSMGVGQVGMLAIEPVGNYAIRINFDDLHDTGIYSWDTLYDYGQRQDELWQDYLDALKAQGLSRNP